VMQASIVLCSVSSWLVRVNVQSACALIANVSYLTSVFGSHSWTLCFWSCYQQTKHTLWHRPVWYMGSISIFKLKETLPFWRRKPDVPAKSWIKW
jgi:hypothetical protein